MSCGLKKQNNQKGGVHLTERTCSPYNPIIKQIVDDCLGLPIYPVSSIDAVINEDGNTLRKLLDDLAVLIKTGDVNIEELQERIDNINNAIEDLDDTYATDEQLNNVKALLWAIGGMTIVGDGTELNSVDQLTHFPVIVQYVSEVRGELSLLRSKVTEFLGEGVETPTLTKILETIVSLENLLRALAGFNSTFDVSDYDNQEDIVDITTGVIKIIQEIINIKDTIGMSSDPEESGESLIDKVDALRNDVDTLINKVEALENNSAHLDDLLLKYEVLKLDPAEYPVTSVKFINDTAEFRDLMKELEPQPDGKHVFIYFRDDIKIGYSKTNPDDPNDRYDFNRDGTTDLEDIAVLVTDGILGNASVDSAFNVNEDDTVNIADTNALLNIILNTNDSPDKAINKTEWGNYIFEFIWTSDTALPELDSSLLEIISKLQGIFPGYKIVPHKLIKGKVYIDSATNIPYIYAGNRKMERVLDIKIESRDKFKLANIDIEEKALTISLLPDNNKVYKCDGTVVDGQYVIDEDTNFKVNDLFVLDSTYSVIGVPRNALDLNTSNLSNEAIATSRLWIKVLAGDPILTELNELDEQQIVTIADNSYAKIGNDWYKFNPLTLNNLASVYSINDISYLVDLLLNAPSADYTQHVQNNRNKLEQEVSILQERAQEADPQQLALIETIILEILKCLNNPSPIKTVDHLPELKNIIYITRDNTTASFIEVPSKYYNKIGRLAQLSYTGSGVPQVQDVTALVDAIINQSVEVPKTSSVLGRTLWMQKAEDEQILITAKTPGAYGRIFELYEESDDDRDLYYFDSQEAFIPVVPKIELSYDADSNTLFLNINSTLTAIRLGEDLHTALNKTLALFDDDVTVMDLGYESQPYFEHVDSNYLDSNGFYQVGYTSTINLSLEYPMIPNFKENAIYGIYNKFTNFPWDSFIEALHEVGVYYKDSTDVLDNWDDEIMFPALQLLSGQFISIKSYPSRFYALDCKKTNVVSDSSGQILEGVTGKIYELQAGVQLPSFYAVNNFYDLNSVLTTYEPTLLVRMVNRYDIRPNIIYKFTRFGLEVSFMKIYNSDSDSYALIPSVNVINQVEVLIDPSNVTGLLSEPVQNTNIEVELLPNVQFILYGSNITLWVHLLLAIPGIRNLDISGKFISPINNPTILICTELNAEALNTPAEYLYDMSSTTIMLADNLPTIEANEVYEYHIKDNLFSYHKIS